MKKALALVAGLAVLAGMMTAQTHDDQTEKAVKETLTLASDVAFGGVVLPAGDYRVVCDTKTVTFSRTKDGKKVLDVPCRGQALSEPATTTTLYTRQDASGARVAERLLLRGSNVEHVFK